MVSFSECHWLWKYCRIEVSPNGQSPHPSGPSAQASRGFFPHVAPKLKLELTNIFLERSGT